MPLLPLYGPFTFIAVPVALPSLCLHLSSIRLRIALALPLLHFPCTFPFPSVHLPSIQRSYPFTLPVLCRYFAYTFALLALNFPCILCPLYCFAFTLPLVIFSFPSTLPLLWLYLAESGLPLGLRGQVCATEARVPG